MIDPYSTHQPSLMLAVANTVGPILELGAGHYSTPLLHALSSGRRRLITADSDSDWLHKFDHLVTPWHTFVIVETDHWQSACWRIAEYGTFSVCFVDHAPPEARGPAIVLLSDAVQVFVCHDSQEAEGDPNGWRHILASFKYRRDDKRHQPETTIVSDAIDVRNWPEI